MTRGKLIWPALMVAAALAPSAAAVGVYFNGGLASFGDLETEVALRGFLWKNYEDLGASYWIGGGFVVPAWRYPAKVSPSLELVTDVGFSSQAKELEIEPLRGYELSFKVIPVRENVIFGVAVGPAKPFVGFSAGVAVVPWKVTGILSGVEIDSQTEVKAALGIPFGCEFRLTPNLALGARAEYLIITGEVTPELPYEYVRTFMPDSFLLTGVARVDF